MIPIYIGYDRKETIAYHVLSHSLISRTKQSLAITPIYNGLDEMWRPRGEHDSTDFSNARWLAPHLQGFDGWVIFMDSDMLCLADINELWEQRDDRYAVMVKKHDHVPTETRKFLGQEQSKYLRKNWSSLMLMNTERCHALSLRQVNTHTPGLWFHQFSWLPDESIGDIEGEWNHLVGYDEPSPTAKLAHYTLGGPWHHYDTEYSDEWWLEYEDMLQGDNPVRYRETQTENPGGGLAESAG